MLIHFVGAGFRTQSLTPTQSRSILQFCRSEGATLFTVNYLFVKGGESEKLMERFYQRLSSFSISERQLENVGGNRFSKLDCWVLNDQSIEVILKETGGDLLAYDVTNFLSWAAEPSLEARHSTGVKVMAFLLICAGLFYGVKRKIWAGVH